MAFREMLVAQQLCIGVPMRQEEKQARIFFTAKILADSWRKVSQGPCLAWFQGFSLVPSSRFISLSLRI